MATDTSDFRVNSRKHGSGAKNTETTEMWRRASQPLTSFEESVRKALIDGVALSISNMIKSAKGATIITDEVTYGVCIGDHYYMANRALLLNKAIIRNIHGSSSIKMNLVPNDCKFVYLEHTATDSEKAKSGKHISSKTATSKNTSTTKNTADKIKQANSTKTIAELITKMMTVLNAGELILPRNYLSHEILEIRGIAFLYLAWWVSKNRSHYFETCDMKLPFNVIVAIQRFIKTISICKLPSYVNTATTVQFSRGLLSDMENILSGLIEQFKFDGLALYEKVPDLIAECEYDIFIPRKSVKPYPHQMTASNILLNKSNYSDGCIVFNTVQTNAGKTSGIVAIVAALKFMRGFQSGINKVLIATCPVRAVLSKMANFLYHCDDMPFGIATIRTNRDGNRELKISYGYACKGRPENCIAIICNSEAALWLLKEDNAMEKYILFQDEVTYGADIGNVGNVGDSDAHDARDAHDAHDAHDARDARDDTDDIILSARSDRSARSANSLQSSALELNMKIIMAAPKIIYLCSATLSDIELNRAISDKFKVKYPAATVVDISSNTIYGCSNIMSNSGSGIMPYSGCTTREELRVVIENIERKPFYGKFNNPLSLMRLVDTLKDNACAKAIVSDLPNLREFFADVDNLVADNVRKVAMDILKIVATHVSSSDEIVKLICEKVKLIKHEVDYTKLGTSDAYLYPTMNLIATTDPVKFALTNFSKLITDIKKKCKSIRAIIGDYDKKLEAWGNGRVVIEKLKLTSDEMDRQLCEYDELRPTIDFPKELQINTRAHIKKYGGDDALLKSKRFRGHLLLGNVDFEGMNTSDELQLLLCAGVGIFVGKESSLRARATQLESSLRARATQLESSLRVELASHTCESNGLSANTVNTENHVNDVYLDTVLELASQGRLEYLIADSSIVYGTDYPIGGVFITEEFSNKHSLNTIYQLISRAGRGSNAMFANVYMPDSCAQKIIGSVQGYNSHSKSCDIEKLNMMKYLAKLN